MKESTKRWIGIGTLAIGVGVGFWVRYSDRESTTIVAVDAPPADVVRFTATKAYARLPAEERLKYLLAWQQVPMAEKQQVLASLMSDPKMLQISGMQSMEVSRLLQARAYYKLANAADRKAFLDAHIDAEEAMFKQVKQTVDQAQQQSGQAQLKQLHKGDPLVRKFILENSIPTNRLEISAYANDMEKRRRERGLDQG
jgi:hypothetical protein